MYRTYSKRRKHHEKKSKIASTKKAVLQQPDTGSIAYRQDFLPDDPKGTGFESGINQANISKIENGIYNPSLTIIRRLAEAMDMDLQLKLIPREDQSFCTSSSSSSVGTANV
ncbi:MAG: helix-turn-helix transcriptional regulator [Erysipelotrichaceae bacterium]|nr:helix-turn-helix transcriptional regulator [Erysipelotrichaceae bacterium]